MFPSYLELNKNIFKQRIKEAWIKLKKCDLCPRNCGVNRLKGEIGFCCTSKDVYVSSYNVHMGEEPPLVGIYGSGTIFFTHCNLRCKYCQNYPISQLGNGKKTSILELAEMMLYLQNKKCHNINFVTPSHVIPQILAAVFIAIKKGMKIPLVYNSSGYDSVSTLKLLDGVIDIYMPDAKYGDNKNAEKYSSCQDYPEYNKLALKEMYKQVGNLKIDKNGIAKKGLLIRHLVLPHNIANSEKVLTFIANEISLNTYLSVMSQYFPAYKAPEISLLNRKIKEEEYNEVIDLLEKLKFKRGWIQPKYV